AVPRMESGAATCPAPRTSHPTVRAPPPYGTIGQHLGPDHREGWRRPLGRVGRVAGGEALGDGVNASAATQPCTELALRNSRRGHPPGNGQQPALGGSRRIPLANAPGRDE